MPTLLVACEESQRVCTAFRERGWEAYSCDLQEPSGGHPEWHIQGDCLPLLTDDAVFMTMDGAMHHVQKWDLVIAHPPCTYITSASSAILLNSDHSVRDTERETKAWKSVVFFWRILLSRIDRLAVENPAPMKRFELPEYSQIIEPYMFGHPCKKRTCLWLKGIPHLIPTNYVVPTYCHVKTSGNTTRTKLNGPGGTTSAKERSKTFPGIAAAMADQWGSFIEKELEKENERGEN